MGWEGMPLKIKIKNCCSSLKSFGSFQSSLWLTEIERDEEEEDSDDADDGSDDEDGDGDYGDDGGDGDILPRYFK